MNHDDGIDRRLEDAFADRTASVRVTPPDMDDLLDRGRRHSRRMLAAATLGVLVVGTVGLSVLAGAGDTTPPDALSDSLPAPDDVPSTTGIGGSIGDCGDRTHTQAEPCPADEALSSVPDSTSHVAADATIDRTTTLTVQGDLTPACPIPACPPPEYIVQVGDSPLMVAAAFCTSVDDLVATNGWANANEFPLPGVAISLPPVAAYCIDPNSGPGAGPDATTTAAD